VFLKLTTWNLSSCVMTGERNEEKLFFFNLEGDTRKVTCFGSELGSLADLVPMAQNKYGDKIATSTNLEFWTTDQAYNVRHKLDSLEDIYDGAVIEVVNQQKRKREEDNQGQDPKRVRLGPRFVLRLRGLPWECTPGDLKEFFKGIELLDAHIIYLSSGRASGEGVVEVGSQEAFENALAKNNEHIGSRWIEVFKSTGEDIDRAMGRVNPAGDGGVENASNSVIRMRGLPFAALESDINEFFAQASVKPARVHLVREEGLGRPSGVAYAEFSTEEECNAAMGCNNKNIGTRYIELFKSTISDLKVTCGYNDSVYNPAMAGVQFGSGYNGQFGGGFGQFRGDGNHCVKMRGLPYNSNEKDITAFFQEGGVTPTRIHRNPDGGEAYVEFVNGNDAQKAMDRNRAHIGHRYIELFRVSYDEIANVVGLPRGGPMQPQQFYQGY